MAKLIVARFPGTCADCGTRIRAGDTIWYGDGRARCQACGDARQAAVAPAVAPVAPSFLLDLEDGGTYVWKGGIDTKDLPKAAGLRWDPERRRWWTRYADAAVRLREWASPAAVAAMAAVTQATDASRAASVEALPEAVAVIPLPALPEGLALLPFQGAGCRAILASAGQGQRAWLLADEMGLGKTVQALVLTQAWATQGRPVLVVCPASLRRNWRAETSRWRPGARTYVVANGKDPLPAPEDVDVVVISYEGATKRAAEMMARPWSCLVCDESHSVKNRLAKRTKAVCGAWDKENGHMNGLADKADRVLFLTGTPILNRPAELWTTLEVLGHGGKFGGWMAFAKRYCAAKQVVAGHKIVWDFSGASNLEQLQARLRASGQVVRRLKADVLTELPPKRRQIVLLEGGKVPALSDRERAILAALEKAWTDDVDGLSESGGFLFEEASRIRREQASAKVESVLSYVAEVAESGEPLLLFAHHRDVIERLTNGLVTAGITAVCLYGGMTDEQKQAAVDAFQGGQAQVFVGSILAAGVGLTLTRASTVVFAELDWRPAMLIQAEDRCHRIGQRDAVLSQILVVDGTFDSYLAKMIADKMENIEKALDADTTIPYDEQVMATEQERIAHQAEVEALHQAEREAWVALTPKEREAEIVQRVARRRRTDLAEDRLARLGRQEADAAPCDPALAEACRVACAYLAADDHDHAAVRNSVGFGKSDSWYGHAVALVGIETQGQARAVQAMLRRYVRTQLPAALAQAAGLMPATPGQMTLFG